MDILKPDPAIKKYKAACLDRENAATEYQKQTDKKERKAALIVWQTACAVVHDLEHKHPNLRQRVPGPDSR